jgi:hypothetical protein
MKGITQVYWDDIKVSIKNAEPTFFELVEKLSPDNHYPLYISPYDYCDTIGDHQHTFIKDEKGQVIKLNDPSHSNPILSDLNYSHSSPPLMMILDKNLEWMILDKRNQISFPIYVEGPGYFIGISNLLSRVQPKTYLSSQMMLCKAGTASAFMLPNIGSLRNHAQLQRQLGLQSSPPKVMNEHHLVFKEIFSATDSKWQAKILFFSKNWIKSIKNDPEWRAVQQYLIEKLVTNREIDKNRFFYQYAFSKAKTEKNIIEQPFLDKTAKHLLGIAMGTHLGFSPATSSDSLPIKELTHVYEDIYQLKYTPIIFEPAKFDITLKKAKPVYYSMQYPIIHSFEKNKRYISSALVKIELLKRIVTKYSEAFSSDDDCYIGTSLYDASKTAQFNYYHYQTSHDSGISSPAELVASDQRFISKTSKLNCCLDGRFFRGCIKISK